MPFWSELIQVVKGCVIVQSHRREILNQLAVH